MSSFKNKTILITGASLGIGAKTAELLDQVGANLILHASKNDSIEKLKNIFFSDRHSFLQADFSKPEELEESFKKLDLNNLKFDGFINCVGMRSRKPINLLKPSHSIEVLNTNIVSFLEMVRLVTKKNQFNPGCSIVSVSSVASQVGGSGVTVYAASKAAVDAAVRCLAKELYKKEIRINTVVSGQINTEAYKDLMDSKTDEKDPVLERQYLGLGMPKDVAEVILFLLSENSRFITGAAIPADGGFLT